jgi:exodeoxyribonuclease VII small subunit
MNNEKMVSLEEHFSNIEEIIAQMEKGDSTLDKSFELYKNGLEEIKAANSMLETMEKAMLVLNEEGVLEEF